MTGATGFLGGAVCAELLRRTDVALYCPVRGASLAGARARLHANVARCLAASGTHELDARRLRVVGGDITAPRLGLAPARYDELAGTVGAIYHCAASVNLAADHESLAPVNVGGTQNVLRLARHRGDTPVHYISTAAVFTRARQLRHPVVAETTVPTPRMSDVIGYTSSKCEAEHEVRSAAAEGLPTAIYRPGLVLGDSRTGAYSDTEVTVRLLRGAIAVGCAPITTCEVPAVPVDHLARAIVAISRTPHALGAAWHPNAALRVADVFDHARSFGYGLRACTPSQWRGALLNADAGASAYLVLAVWDIMSYLLAITERHRPPAVDCGATARLLEASGVPSPALDEPLFHTILARLAGDGVIPPGSSAMHPPTRRE